MKRKKSFAALLAALVLCCTLFVVPVSAASDIHDGGRLVWSYDGTTYNLTIRCDGVHYDVPIYIGMYNGGVTYAVDYNDIPAGVQPYWCISAVNGSDLETKVAFRFEAMVEDSEALGGKKYWFITFESDDDVQSGMTYCGLSTEYLYDIKETLNQSKSTLYYLADFETGAWDTAVDFFTVDYEVPPEPYIPPYVPTEWWEILTVWVYDLVDALGNIFTGVFSLIGVDLSAVGDFFEALTNGENGVFAWLSDNAFYTQVVSFFGFIGECLSALPTPILYLLRFGLGAGLGVAVLKIISR